MSAPNLRNRPDICEVGRQNRPLHKLWWETQAPDRAVTGPSLGVERWLCQHQSPAAVFLEKADPSLSWGKPGAFPLPQHWLCLRQMGAWPLLIVCGPHLTGHGAPGQKDGAFLVPEVTSLLWKHQGGQPGRNEGEGFLTELGAPPFLSLTGCYLGDRDKVLPPY